MTTDNMTTLTCPQCDKDQLTEMPTDYCMFFYDCVHCKAILRPLPGDDCVYCSYADKLCPPKVLEQQG